jgi:hypothetical protein
VQYLLQCVAGLQDLVARQLSHERLAALRIEDVEQGFVVVSTAAPPGALSQLPYVNNTFLVLGSAEAPSDTIEGALKQLSRDQRWQVAARQTTAPSERTFRLMLYEAGQLVAGPPGGALRAAEVLARVTGLRRNPHQADTEFWFTRRKSGKVFFCKRLSRRTRTEKNLQKGELRPELAWLLCLLSEPSSTDIFMDPFAGSGAIPLARAKLPHATIFCFDADADKISRLKARVESETSTRGSSPATIVTQVGDARDLRRIGNCAIHKIVTDPPWGFFDTALEDPETFYRAVFTEFHRVLAAGGLLVILLGRRELVESVQRWFAGQLEIVIRHDVLVSGKKAVVLKLRKLPPSSGRSANH